MGTYRTLLAATLLAFCLAGCSAFSGLTSSSDSSSTEASAPTNTYLASDDYKDSDEITNTFLNDADYAKMVADVSRGGAEFDWGWVPGKIDSDGDIQSLGFSVGHYHSIYLSPIVDDTGSFDDTVKKALSAGFHKMAARFGWKVVSSKQRADLVLGAHIVDYKADKTYAFVTWIDPFVEIELRMSDRRRGKDLLLLREQKHGTTPAIAARKYARMVYLLLH